MADGLMSCECWLGWIILRHLSAWVQGTDFSSSIGYCQLSPAQPAFNLRRRFDYDLFTVPMRQKWRKDSAISKLQKFSLVYNRGRILKVS